MFLCSWWRTFGSRCCLWWLLGWLSQRSCSAQKLISSILLLCSIRNKKMWGNQNIAHCHAHSLRVTSVVDFLLQVMGKTARVSCFLSQHTLTSSQRHSQFLWCYLLSAAHRTCLQCDAAAFPPLITTIQVQSTAAGTVQTLNRWVRNVWGLVRMFTPSASYSTCQLNCCFCVSLTR